MQTNPLVSAVIPTYKRTQQTFAAIESVLEQTYSNVEVVVVDDGSPDGSGVLVERFVREKVESGHRVRFISQENRGASAARNTGIANAQGEYIGFLDSDDLWRPEKLEWQMRAIQQFAGDCQACVTDARLVNDAGMDCTSFYWQGIHFPDSMGVDIHATKALAKTFKYWISSLIARADKLRQIGGFDERISFIEDRDLQFRLSLVSRIAYINRPLIQTDRTPSPPGSTCRPWDEKAVQLKQQELMLEGWLRMNLQLPRGVERVIRQSLGSLHSQCANWHLENCRYAEAREAVSKAVQYKKTPGTVLKFALTSLTPLLARRIVPRTRPIGSDGHAS